MPSREEIFKERFAGALADIAILPDEQKLLLGTLASGLLKPSGAPTWSMFKRILGRDDYQALLTTFQRQGPELDRLGKREEIAAIEVLGISLIAKTLGADPEIAAGTVVLDQAIDDALVFYKDAMRADPVIS